MRASPADTAIAVAIFAFGAVLVWVENDGPRVGSIALAATYTLPLTWRRRAPLVTVLAIVAGVSSVVVLDARASIIVLAALALAALTAGRQLDPPQSQLAMAAAIGMPLLVSAMISPTAIADQVLFALLIGGAWLAGRTTRVREQHLGDLAERFEMAERERDESGRRAVEAERTRIARELHDIVSHSISVITTQAEGVRRRLTSDQRVEAERLRDIETSARDAMVELRRLLGVLRDEADRAPLAPQPGLDQLPRLVDQTLVAGVPVALIFEGERRPLSAGVDLTAYRIVQEALTNTLRHAGPATATVTIVFGDDVLRMRVEDTGRGSTKCDGDGRGIIGMRERVALYDGTLVAEGCPGGGFRVEAVLPLRAGAPS